MKNWNPLIEKIRQLLRASCIFPKTIKPVLQEKFKRHNAHTLEVLEAILRADFDDDDKMTRLRLFLLARWHLTMHTSIDYTFNPDFPANLACFHVATALADEEKAVCQLLMPTIRQVIGSGFGEGNLKEASESPIGTFPLHEFLISAHGNLMSVLDLYDYATKDPDYLFGDKFGLTELDRHHLKICAGDASSILFDMIRKNYLNKHSRKESVGTLLRELITALYKSSKKESGNEYQANSLEALPAIHAFHAHWKSMPDDSRNSARYLKVRGATLSLESFLLCLFVRAKLDVTPEEFERVTREHIMPCAHDISQQLDTLFNENINLLCELPLSEIDTDAAHVAPVPDFSAQMERLLEAVVNRAPIAGFSDQHFFYRQSLEHLTYYHLTNEAYIAHLNASVLHINNVAQFSSALCFIPESFWAYFAEALKMAGNFHFSETRDEIPNMQYLLEQLSISQWTTFFQAFHTVIPHWIDAMRLSRIALSFKAEKLKAFIESIYSFLPQLLSTGKQIGAFFLERQEDGCTTLFRLFETHIERVLAHPRELVDCFNVLYQEGVLLVPLLKLLMPTLKAKLCEDENHFFITVQLFSNTECSLHFLKAFVIASPEFKIEKAGLMQLLRHYGVRYYELLLIAIAPTLPYLIAKPSDLSALLAALNPGEERDLFAFHLIDHIQFEGTDALTVYAILKQFPDCEHVLLSMFEPCLHTILVDLSDNLMSYTKLGLHHPPSNEVVRLFDFFFEKALPILLSNDYLKDNLIAWTVYELQGVENVADTGFHAYRQLLGASPIERLRIIVSFMNAQAPAANTQVFIFLRHTSALYHDLTEHFGKNFFQRLLSVHEQRKIVPLHPPFANQGFFAEGQHRAPHPVLAARAVYAAPEPIAMTPPPSPR